MNHDITINTRKSMADRLGGASVLAEHHAALLAVAVYVLDSKRVQKSIDRLVKVEGGAFDTLDLMCPTWDSPDSDNKVLDQLGVLLAASLHDMDEVNATITAALHEEEVRAGYGTDLAVKP